MPLQSNIFKLAVALASLLYVAFSLPTGHEPSPLSDMNTTSLTYLGSVEGKYFFADITKSKTWAAAKLFCANEKMQLASITSLEQSTFLAKVSGTGGFDGYFWIGARDSLTHSQFSWDHNNDTLQNIAVPTFYPSAINTCLMYHIGAAAHDKVRGDYHAVMCVTPSIGALCEIPII